MMRAIDAGLKSVPQSLGNARQRQRRIRVPILSVKQEPSRTAVCVGSRENPPGRGSYSVLNLMVKKKYFAVRDGSGRQRDELVKANVLKIVEFQINIG